MAYRKIVVAGGGVLGSQIAFQSAYCGFDVTIWLRSEGSITRTQPKLDDWEKAYIRDIEDMTSGTGSWCYGIGSDDGSFDKSQAIALVHAARKSIRLELDLQAAVKDADLIIESMAEDKEQKIAFYKMLAPLMEEKTVLVTNSSTLLPSTFAKFTGRPDKYLSLHFANLIWKYNTAEVMVQEKTDQRYFKEVIDFANDIRMVALPVMKEKNGYLLNSLLVPLLLSAVDLYVSGVSDPKSIDTAWKKGTGAPAGPFEILDVVGLQTAYNIVAQYQKVPKLINPILKKMLMPYNFKDQLQMLKKYIDEGKLGRSSGEGFYKY